MVVKSGSLVQLDVEAGLWERFHSVFPLVLVATTEATGEVDIAPKHMAMPMSWQNHFGFVCAPHHATYQNIVANEVFTVGYPSPEMLVYTSLAAAPRASDGSKPTLQMLSTRPATVVDGVLVTGCRVSLECRLERVVENLGDNALLIGTVVAAHATEDMLRSQDTDDHELIANASLLSYVHPGRVATITETKSFPFHAGFRR
jgi:flavin reductase (DIM6/NTAB) family NADH-FMN oxidoreductase RutF